MDHASTTFFYWPLSQLTYHQIVLKGQSTPNLRSIKDIKTVDSIILGMCVCFTVTEKGCQRSYKAEESIESRLTSLTSSNMIPKYSQCSALTMEDFHNAMQLTCYIITISYIYDALHLHFSAVTMLYTHNTIHLERSLTILYSKPLRYKANRGLIETSQMRTVDA